MCQCDDQRLVQQALQAGRRISRRHARDTIDRIVLVEVIAVCFLPQVVRHDVGSGRTTGEPEVDGPVEAPGADQRGIEIILAVGCPDDQHVGGHERPLLQMLALGEGSG